MGQRHTVHVVRIGLEDARRGDPRMGSRPNEEQALLMNEGNEGARSPVAARIAIVPAPSAVISTIRARQTWCCGLLRSPTTPSSRPQSPGWSRTAAPSLMRPDSQVRTSIGIINGDQTTKDKGQHPAGPAHSSLAKPRPPSEPSRAGQRPDFRPASAKAAVSDRPIASGEKRCAT